MASALVAACLLFLAAAASAQGDELVVRTPLGVVRGVYSAAEQARAFLGIPYAQPPVGDLRWQWPAPVQPWGDLNATEPPPGCMQNCHDPAYTCPEVISEDCLYLNVFAPRLQPGGPAANPPAPVFVFVHGGNFRTGQGAAPLYSGRYLANATGTVVVTVNYRLGALGWLLSPGAGGLPGNQGLHDVAAALRWVQQNIASFGGDPSRVTLAGQSAGAVITGVMMYSDLGQGLFSRAMQISNLMGLPLRSVTEAYGLQAFVAGQLGCDPSNTACLLAANASAVLAAGEAALGDIQLDSAHFLEAFLCFSPVAGTPEVPVQPYQAAIGGLVRPVPLVLGNTASEGTLFVGLGFANPVPASAYDVVLGVVSGSINGALTLAAEYPATNASDARGAMTLAADDVVFLCPAQNATLNMGLRAPVYRYSFDRVSSFNQWVWGPNQSFCYDVVCHGSDLFYYFNAQLEYASYGLKVLEEESDLAARVGALVGNFAATGNPNGPGAEAWPLFNASTLLTHSFNTPADTDVYALHGAQCKVCDSLGGYPMP